MRSKSLILAVAVMFLVVGAAAISGAAMPWASWASSMGSSLGVGDKEPPSLESVFLKNKASKVDGTGLNVPTCVEMLARRYRLSDLAGFREWTALERGGHYPSKIADQLHRWCKLKDVNVPPYVQFYTKDISLVESMVKDRWVMAAVNGGKNTRYKNFAPAAAIIIHLDKHGACLLDPNWREPEWITRAEFEKQFGQWVFMFLAK